MQRIMCIPANDGASRLSAFAAIMAQRARDGGARPPLGALVASLHGRVLVIDGGLNRR